MKNPAAGGGRWVEVAPGRFPTWMDEFGLRHGGVRSAARDEAGVMIAFAAADGSIAECHPPFPPVPESAPGEASAAMSDWPVPPAAAIAAHVLRDRTVGVLLVRLGGYAVGVFSGSPPALTASKTGSRPVHGRSAAGGWSQHRFARRREKQASEALGAAANAAVAVLGAAQLDAVVLGGDKRAVAELRDEARLLPYLARAEERFLTVPDPRLAVLRETPRSFLAIRIRLIEAKPDGPGVG